MAIFKSTAAAVISTAVLLSDPTHAFAPKAVSSFSTAIGASEGPEPIDFWTVEMEQGYKDGDPQKEAAIAINLDPVMHEEMVIDHGEFGQLSMHRWTVPKGHKIKPHSHDFLVPNIVKEGKLKVTTAEGKEFIYGQGDMFAMPVGTVYEVEALDVTIYTCWACPPGHHIGY